MRRANQRRDYAGLRQKLNKKGAEQTQSFGINSSKLVLYTSYQRKTKFDYYLWVELARKVLRHSHAGRAGLKLLLVEHTVNLA